MAMDLRDYLNYRCSETLALERECWNLNRRMVQECAQSSLKEVLQRHGELLREQISNLEQAVDTLGGFAGPEESAAGQGIVYAYQQFIARRPPEAVVDIHHAQVSEKLCRMMIADYDGLLALARLAQVDEIAEKLEWNRRQEDRLLHALQEVAGPLVDRLSGELRRAA